jgi:hypothetical protein
MRTVTERPQISFDTLLSLARNPETERDRGAAGLRFLVRPSPAHFGD